MTSACTASRPFMLAALAAVLSAVLSCWFQRAHGHRSAEPQAIVLIPTGLQLNDVKLLKDCTDGHCAGLFVPTEIDLAALTLAARTLPGPHTANLMLDFNHIG